MKKIFKVNQNIKKKLVNTLELPKEIIFNLPLITIVGNEEINIENYKGVIEYSPEKIRINTECGVLKINGEKLSFKQITAENIIVTGIIQTLEYLS
ncbi:MAG: sporulation protein YqfC [Firmicutes bacterium]|nr:sporulation protein YqfC [Bacillota bacterium]